MYIIQTKQTGTFWLLNASRSIICKFFQFNCNFYSPNTPFKNYYLLIMLYAVISAPSDTKKHEQKDDDLPVDIKLPVKHILSRELQVLKFFRHHELSCFTYWDSFLLVLLFLTDVF